MGGKFSFWTALLLCIQNLSYYSGTLEGEKSYRRLNNSVYNTVKAVFWLYEVVGKGSRTFLSHFALGWRNHSVKAATSWQSHTEALAGSLHTSTLLHWLFSSFYQYGLSAEKLYILIWIMWLNSNCSENLSQTEQNDKNEREILHFNSYVTAKTCLCTNPLE